MCGCLLLWCTDEPRRHARRSIGKQTGVTRADPRAANTVTPLSHNSDPYHRLNNHQDIRRHRTAPPKKHRIESHLIGSHLSSSSATTRVNITRVALAIRPSPFLCPGRNFTSINTYTRTPNPPATTLPLIQSNHVRKLLSRSCRGSAGCCWAGFWTLAGCARLPCGASLSISDTSRACSSAT